MQGSVRRYSAIRRRSLIAMVARRTLFKVNGSASSVLVKPFVVMAARFLGPGRTRLRLVKLAHNLDSNGAVAKPGRSGYDETRRLFTPADGRRRLVLGAFRRVLGSRSTGRPPKTLGVTGTPVVGGVSATDERLRQVPGAEAAADARPGGREPAPRSKGAPPTAPEADPGH